MASFDFLCFLLKSKIQAQSGVEEQREEGRGAGAREGGRNSVRAPATPWADQFTGKKG